MTYRLLAAFRGFFERKRSDTSIATRPSEIRVRWQSAAEVYEDIHSLGRSAKFLASVASMQHGVGSRNKTVWLVRMRRGASLNVVIDLAKFLVASPITTTHTAPSFRTR